ncbi:MAG: AtpZ/AtpI family protein [Bacteroidota bacterium]
MKKKAPLSGYAKYSAIGLQMGGIIAIMTFLGRYLDSFKWLEFPVFTIVGILVGVFGAMYYIIKQL